MTIYESQATLDGEVGESQVLKNVRDGYLALGYVYVFEGGTVECPDGISDIRDVNAVMAWPVRKKRFGEFLGKIRGLAITGGPGNARIVMRYFNDTPAYAARKTSREWRRRRRMKRQHIEAQEKLKALGVFD